MYAPIGFVLEARKLLPSFIERGRQQVQMAKVIGQFAVKQGQTEATKRLTAAQTQAESILGELGLAPQPRSSNRNDHRPRAAKTVDTEPATASPRIRSSAAAADLPIADYDSLAASQVVPRLGGLEPHELDAVRAYELAHRGRKTILGKVAQLTGE